MRFLWFFLLATFIGHIHADSKPLVLGVIPYVTTSKIITHNNIVRKHLNNTTDFDISLVSAKNLKTYIKNMKEYKYDIILSAPHLARYAQKNYHYQPIVVSDHTISGVYITKRSSSISSIPDLNGKVVSLISPKSIIHQMVLKQARESGLDPHKDMKIKVVKTFNNALYDVINGYSHATVTGIKIWKELPSKVKKDLKQFAKTDPTTGFILLAKPDISKETISAIQTSLLAFNQKSYAKKYLFNGFKLITDKDMESLDLFAKTFE